MEITKQQIKNDQNISSALNQSKILYMEGFFITKRFETAKYFIDYAKQNKKAFVFNISAPYLCDAYPDDMKFFVENCDILFGNIQEYTALCKIFKLDSIDKLFEYLCSIYNNEKELEFDKILVMTNGSKSVHCMHSQLKKETMQVPQIERNKIKDTVGAGDSFVAGFLAGLCFGNGPEVALKWGCCAAKEIIQQTGCTIPSYSSDFIRES